MANTPTPTNTVRLPSTDDEALIEAMGKIAALSKDARLEFQILGRTIGPFANAEELFLLHPRSSWSGRRILNVIEVSGVGTMRIKCHRAVTNFDGGTARVEPSEFEMEVSVLYRPEQGEPSPETIVAVSDILDSYRSKTRIARQPSREMPSYGKVFARQLADLTTLQTKILSEADEARARREAELDERRSTQDQAIEELKAKLAEDYDLQRKLLQVQEQALETRKRDLDDRTHMHARRALREHITEELRERLSRPPVSRSTMVFRLGIFLAGALLVGLLSLFAVQSGVELAALLKAQAGQTTTANVASAEPIAGDLMAYVLIGRAALAAAGAVALGFYLLNWARQLHDADLRSERDLERYRYDLDRATWAIETILEAQKGGSVPEQWIAGATHSLFSRSERRDDDQSSVEALGALLSFAAEAEFGPNGPKFKLTKQGINKLKRSGLLEPEAE